MNNSLAVMAAVVGLSIVSIDADARRMGGGSSIGKQRPAITQQQAAPKAPAQQPAATAAPAQPASGASKWLGPLAGLALGAGLASLFLNNGLAGGLGALLMIAALVAAAVFVVRMLRARTANPPIQYAGAGAQTDVQPQISPVFGGGSAAPNSVAATTGLWPAGFDAAEFARHAKLNFVDMQAAHDRKDLSAIRDRLTPDLCKEIEADMRASGDAPQTTDVVTLNAEVLDVVTEAELYVVSVRFSGLIREAANQEPQAFSEIWHLEKPVSGRSGWMVSGIQQN